MSSGLPPLAMWSAYHLGATPLPAHRNEWSVGQKYFGFTTCLPSVPPLAQRCVAITADPCTAQEETRRWWVGLLWTAWETWGTHALALADQAVVSAASFLTTVMIARWTLPNELGLYSIGISLLVSSLSIQESLISLPYTIQQHRAPGTPAEHAGSSLTHSTLLSALGIVVLAVMATDALAGAQVISTSPAIRQSASGTAATRQTTVDFRCPAFLMCIPP